MRTGRRAILEHRVDDFGDAAALAALIVVGRHARHPCPAWRATQFDGLPPHRWARRRESCQPDGRLATNSPGPVECRLAQALVARAPSRIHHGRAAVATLGMGGCVTSRATLCRSWAIFSLGNLRITGWPSFEAITAFGPFETMVADTGRPRVLLMSPTAIPWFARLTTTRTMSPRPTSRASARNWALLRRAPTSGVTTRKISVARVSIAMVRSS